MTINITRIMMLMIILPEGASSRFLNSSALRAPKLPKPGSQPALGVCEERLRVEGLRV